MSELSEADKAIDHIRVVFKWQPNPRPDVIKEFFALLPHIVDISTGGKDIAYRERKQPLFGRVDIASCGDQQPDAICSQHTSDASTQHGSRWQVSR